MDLATYLIEKTKKEGINTRQLAKKINIPYTTLRSIYKRDPDKLSYKTMMLLLNYYGISSESIIKQIEEKEKENIKKEELLREVFKL